MKFVIDAFDVRNNKLFIGIVVVLAFIYLASPYYVIHKLKNASSRDNYAYVDEYMAYTDIKDSVLNIIKKDMMTAKGVASPSGFGSYGYERSSALVAEQLLERFFTKDLLTKYLYFILNEKYDGADFKDLLKHSADYVGINFFEYSIDITDFVLRAGPQDNYENYSKDFFKSKRIVVTLLLKRDGYFSWKLVSVKSKDILPLLVYFEGDGKIALTQNIRTVDGTNQRTASESVKKLKRSMTTRQQHIFETSYGVLGFIKSKEGPDAFLHFVDGKTPDEIIDLARQEVRARIAAGDPDLVKYGSWENLVGLGTTSTSK